MNPFNSISFMKPHPALRPSGLVRLIGLFLALCLPGVVAAPLPQSSWLATVGTSWRQPTGQDWAYFLYQSSDGTALAGRTVAVYRKDGEPNSPALFTRQAVTRLQDNPAVIAPLLDRSVNVGEDLNELADHVTGLFQSLIPAPAVSLPERLAAVVQGLNADPSLHSRVLLLSRRHPGAALAFGMAWTEPLPAGIAAFTYELRDHDPVSGTDRAVIARVTIRPGAALVLPAPGIAVDVPTNSPQADLLARLRWSTPDPLRRLAPAQMGFNVYRIPTPIATTLGFTTNPPAAGLLATLARQAAGVERVNEQPVVPPKEYSTADVANFVADPTTVFITDDRARFRGGPGFVDGDRFCYFVVARDILGRDGQYTLPLYVINDTVIEAYGSPATGNARSAIVSARYQFTKPWYAIDSDGDGVPDFVEQVHGINPQAGSDTDRDGFSDFDEILSGFHPGRTNSAPGSNHIVSTLIFPVDLSVTPQPFLIPVAGGGANTGVVIQVRTPQGALVAEAPTSRKILQDPPSADLKLNFAAGSIVSLSTPEHFEATPARKPPEEPSGRELLGVVTVPPPAYTTVPFVPPVTNVPLTPEGQTAAWEAFARTFIRTNPPPQVDTVLQPVDVLVAVLMERKLDLLIPTNAWPRTNRLSLFPHRPRDAGRTNPPVDALNWLGSPLRSNTWNLNALLSGLNQGTKLLTNPQVAQLRLLNSSLYGVYTLESSTTLSPDAPWGPETLPTQGSALGTKLPGDPIGTRQRFYRLIQE